ncbi:MAG: glycosyl transferase group 1, partial [Chloroflexi bacterium]|nr:glycosyl transferase group 1 [Chloroflexota bacterium]
CYCLRRRYRVIFTDGEQIGIPLAFFLKYANLGKRPVHFMIGHLLSVGKKTALLDSFRLASHIDIFFVYSTWQQRFIERRWNLLSDRVIFTPFMVDADFFSPIRSRSGDPLDLVQDDKPLICAVGLEYRDYPTLIEAVRDLDVHVVIAAASPWSKRSDSTQGQQIPDNVTVRRFSQFELRDLYAASRFLVMPLYPVDFQAGVTAILEAMAMELPVICSQTPGQTDVVISGQTGLYVPPSDPLALKTAIQELLSQPDLSDRLGHSGRIHVLNEMSLDCYVERLNRFIQQASSYNLSADFVENSELTNTNNP